MKKTVSLVVMMFVALFSVATVFAENVTVAQSSAKVDLSTIEPTDYSKEASWMFLDKKLACPVDTVYFYPTATIKPAQEGGVVGDISDVKNKMGAKQAYIKSASAFEDYTNMFAPYYRQISAEALTNQVNSVEDMEKLMKDSAISKKDVFAALDYYFNNLNNGRPFILSAHSQGSFMLRDAFSEYFCNHKEYLDRMVAAYLVGCPITKKWLKKNGLKFAKGETDTGVIISWLSEGPEATKGSTNGALSINPINWKRDATPAKVEENKGTMIVDKTNKVTIEKGLADATLNLKRGTVVCTTKPVEYSSLPLFIPLFGTQSFHVDDYTLYYENVKENGQKRVNAYLEKNKK